MDSGFHYMDSELDSPRQPHFRRPAYTPRRNVEATLGNVADEAQSLHIHRTHHQRLRRYYRLTRRGGPAQFVHFVYLQRSAMLGDSAKPTPIRRSFFADRPAGALRDYDPRNVAVYSRAPLSPPAIANAFRHHQDQSMDGSKEIS
jgi:hypothetical protein